MDSTLKTVTAGLPDAIRDQLRNLSPGMATTIRQLLAAVETERRRLEVAAGVREG